MTAVHVVVPDGVDDPARPSGGNTYDRYVCRHLGLLGWSVHEHPAPGPWPRRDPGSLGALAQTMRQIPEDSAVLLDGLVASTAPEVLVAEARRLRLVMLVHMPLGHRPSGEEAQHIRRRERIVLRAAAAVVTTSHWGRTRLLDLYELNPRRVHAAEPGVERADLAAGTAAGVALLSVAAVCFEKGHDILVEALRAVSDESWRCVCVGSLDRAPAFAASLVRHTVDSGLRHRLSFVGPRTGSDLDRTYKAADLLVLASRVESYGMVLTEALARGVPVVATEVGGVPEAMGYGAEGIRPGLLVPPENAAALAAALRAWLSDGELRRRLRRAARDRRESLPRWSATASVIAGALAGTLR